MQPSFGNGDVPAHAQMHWRRTMALFAAGLVAQQAAGQQQLEEIVVTGSRIARPDFSSASPIVSVTSDLFERSGARTVEAALNTLPQLTPTWTSTSNNPGNGGQANVSLRGLGPTSTLVLVDGKRLIPADGSGVPDLNVIPASLIESVEVITGGASAVYGSDALAGVVNLKLRHEFDGVEIDGTWGQTDRGDGTQYETSLTAGTQFADGRGSVIASASYAERELVTQGQRDFSRYPLVYLGPGAGRLGPGDAFLPFGSPSIEEGRVEFPGGNRASRDAFDALMTSYGYGAGSVPYQNVFGFNADRTLFTQGGFPFIFSGTPAVANFRGERDPVFFNDRFYTWNFASPNALQLPLDRASAFVRAEFALGEVASVYLQGLYTEYSAKQQAAPTPLFDTLIPVSNPYVPDDLHALAASRPDPAADLVFAKRLSELGPRISDNQYEVQQYTLGVTGRVFDDWRYDAYAQVGFNDQTNYQTGNVLTSKIEELTFAPDGGASICGGFDPFGAGSISSACLDYIAVDASNHAAVDQTIFEISASGPVADLPAGDLQVALGLFYKEDRYEYVAAPVASVFLPDGRPDIQGFSASQDIRGDDHNLDVYGEVLVPLLARVPGARSLDAVLGYRVSDYASAGSFDSWKAELLYRPIDAVRLRGSFQEAVRAPSIYELYLPQLPRVFEYFFFPQGREPCDVQSRERNGPDATRVEALCLAQGVPASALATFQTPDSARGIAGGNPDLGPEEATTATFGVVLTPRSEHPLLSHLQLSLDWYRIEIAARITDVPFADFVAHCYDSAYNADMSVTNRWCDMFGRNAATGAIDGVRMLTQNAYDWETDGVDVQLDWRLDVGPGQLGVRWLVSWIDSLTIGVDDSSAAPEELVGTLGSWAGGTAGVGSAYPEWKSDLYLAYSWQAVTVGAGWRYIDSMIDSDTTLDPEFRVPQANYFDLDASLTVSDGQLQGLELHVGVENVTDEDPPIFPNWVQAGTDPSQYDVLGRRYFVSLRYAF